MKYLKEVCDECGAIKESPMYKYRDNQIITFKKISFDFERHTLNSDKMHIGETKSCLCLDCLNKAEKEFEQIIKKSKYFKYSDLEIF